MSTMDNATIEERCNTLRHDLKSWEKKFAAEHDGRKAGRDDIKSDAAISQKYKEYNKLRDALLGKAAPQTPSKRSSSRRSVHHVDRTPKARPSNPTTTPLKRKFEQQENTSGTPTAVPEFLSPAGPTMIGPTPQRDGIVLGLFDLPPVETPSRKRKVLVDVEPNVLQTPSKNNGKAESEGSIESRVRGERTPLSSGKRYLLDKFVTPQKRKRGEQPGTPTSALKEFSTPAFLRRDNVLTAINEDDEPTPRPAPWKRRGLGRSLSAMIRSMKEEEEKRLDEEVDIMRELEMEEQGIPISQKPKVPQVLVADSQASMPLGPDRGTESDDNEKENEAEVGLDQDGQPRKVWKKRGQKRQTRRVILRPNFTRPKPEPSLIVNDSEEEKPDAARPEDREGYANNDAFSGDDDDASDYATDHSHTPKKQKTQPKKVSNAAKASKEQSKARAVKEGPVKTTARKIKATAHANFRKLKIKSKGSKGGKGRFGRR